MFCGENVWSGLQADEEGNGLLAALFQAAHEPLQARLPNCLSVSVVWFFQLN